MLGIMENDIEKKMIIKPNVFNKRTLLFNIVIPKYTQPDEDILSSKNLVEYENYNLDSISYNTPYSSNEFKINYEDDIFVSNEINNPEPEIKSYSSSPCIIKPTIIRNDISNIKINTSDKKFIEKTNKKSNVETVDVFHKNNFNYKKNIEPEPLKKIKLSRKQPIEEINILNGKHIMPSFFLKNDYYVLKVRCGLCNRLRAIFTYYMFAKDNNKLLIVIWDPGTPVCPGFFLDYFKPIKGVRFIKNNEQNLKIDYEGTAPHALYKTKKYRYTDLELLPYLYNKVKKNAYSLGKDYIAVHIRRTDFKNVDWKESDKTFIAFLNKHAKKNIYIATDNRNTQDYFMNLYPNRIKCMILIEPSNSKRQTTIEAAILDMFTCVYAYKFMGTPGSSFSSTIENIRSMHVREP